MGNCLFLRARGWGIDRQVRKKLQTPGGMPGGGMVTGRIEPCINEGFDKGIETVNVCSCILFTFFSLRIYLNLLLNFNLPK